MSHDVKNIMVILSSVSGVGKTTITKKIQQKYQSFKISVSHTTRKPRSNEVDGVDYHFISKEKFESLIKKKEFYELLSRLFCPRSTSPVSLAYRRVLVRAPSLSLPF